MSRKRVKGDEQDIYVTLLPYQGTQSNVLYLPRDFLQLPVGSKLRMKLVLGEPTSEETSILDAAPYSPLYPVDLFCKQWHEDYPDDEPPFAGKLGIILLHTDESGTSRVACASISGEEVKTLPVEAGRLYYLACLLGTFASRHLSNALELMQVAEEKNAAESIQLDLGLEVGEDGSILNEFKGDGDYDEAREAADQNDSGAASDFSDGV